ncbi:hypothetical protein Q9L58_001998 [Maublancomyces gigas]|uniref:Uncharacterized protein n=1 Tax=Discina gigas TaxID=1032678 RepID=A0ABR3GSQ1_9PEZI
MPASEHSYSSQAPPFSPSSGTAGHGSPATPSTTISALQSLNTPASEMLERYLRQSDDEESVVVFAKSKPRA